MAKKPVEVRAREWAQSRHKSEQRALEQGGLNVEPITSNAESAGKSIVVDLPKHKIDVIENGDIVRTLNDFSTGRQGHLTPLISNGSIDPVLRQRMHYSSRYKDGHGKPAAMPYALFFAGGSGCAFHAGDPDLESHGCIHLAMSDAAWLFDWAGKDKVGLQILGPNPHLVGRIPPPAEGEDV